MGQRVIIDADNNVRIIETGPIGPTGLAGSSNEVGYGFVGVDPNVDFSVVGEGMTLAAFLAFPNPINVEQQFFVAGYGPEVDGMWRGQSMPGTSGPDPDHLGGDPVDWEVAIRTGELPSKMFVVEYLEDQETVFTGNLKKGPWLFTKNEITGEWTFRSIKGHPTGAYLLDLRSETALPYPPGGSGSSSGGVEFGSEFFGSGLPLQYFAVDFSELPDNVDTFVVLLRDGHWGLVPTNWPDEDRGSWTLNVAFENFSPNTNAVVMGSTLEELLTWGFFPTNIDVVVDFHATWGG